MFNASTKKKNKITRLGFVYRAATFTFAFILFLQEDKKKLRTSKTFLRENLLIKNFREKIILQERSKFFMIFSHQLTLSPARSSREFAENILKKLFLVGKL